MDKQRLLRLLRHHAETYRCLERTARKVLPILVKYGIMFGNTRKDVRL